MLNLFLTGTQNRRWFDVCGGPVNDVTNDESCLQQIERIDKEIETVRLEVEQERRRLSHSQTEPSFKNADRSSYGRYSCSETKEKNSRGRKYVVDNRKPRTDLEYDPLSNFSADLRSFSASGKEQKVREERGLKRDRNALCYSQKQKNDHQASPSPSPRPLSDEDGELVIDISLSPDKKRGRVKEVFDVSDKSSSQEEIEINQTVVLGSDTEAAATLQENIVCSSCSGEKSHKSDVNEMFERREQKSCPEAVNVKSSPQILDWKDQNQSQKMNPENQSSLLYKSLKISLELKNTQQTADHSAQKSDVLIRRVHPSLKKHSEPVETSSCSSQTSIKADDEAIIIIDSSSDEKEEFVFSEIELSDSDPMEECYRIFMEAKENEESEEQPDVSVSFLHKHHIRDGGKLLKELFIFRLESRMWRSRVLNHNC